MFYFSIRLIIAVPYDTLSQVHLHRLLDNIFQAMILLVIILKLYLSPLIDSSGNYTQVVFKPID